MNSVFDWFIYRRGNIRSFVMIECMVYTLSLHSLVVDLVCLRFTVLVQGSAVCDT